MPSLIKFFLFKIVGEKCISLTDDINFLFNSSGYGLFLSNVLKPASLWATNVPFKFAAYANAAEFVVSPCTITIF